MRLDAPAIVAVKLCFFFQSGLLNSWAWAVLRCCGETLCFSIGVVKFLRLGASAIALVKLCFFSIGVVKFLGLGGPALLWQNSVFFTRGC